LSLLSFKHEKITELLYLIKVIKLGANPYWRNYLLTFDEYEEFVKTLGDSQFIVSVDVLQKYKT